MITFIKMYINQFLNRRAERTIENYERAWNHAEELRNNEGLYRKILGRRYDYSLEVQDRCASLLDSEYDKALRRLNKRPIWEER